MAFYIAKVPAGQTAATFDGKGKVWSKIYQDKATINGQMVWPNMGTATSTTLSNQTRECSANIKTQAFAQLASRSPNVCRTATTCCVPSTLDSTAPAALAVLNFM